MEPEEGRGEETKRDLLRHVENDTTGDLASLHVLVDATSAQVRSAWASGKRELGGNVLLEGIQVLFDERNPDLAGRGDSECLVGVLAVTRCRAVQSVQSYE